ncbi:hypothetical protein LguiB_001980 [Lonicera macranthoides]
MNLQYSSLPLISASLLFIFFLFFILKNVNSSKDQNLKKLPPGPSKFPIIGNLHQLAGALPHHALRNLAKKYGPIMHLKLGQISTLIISSPDGAKEVMKTHDLIFAYRPQLTSVSILTYNDSDIVFAPYGDYWRQLRKICVLELLSAKRVLSFKSIREEEVRNLIQSISLSQQQGVPINLSEMVFAAINNITMRAVIGTRCKDQDKLIVAIKESLKLTGGFDLPDLFPSLKFLHSISGAKGSIEKVHNKVDKILDNIIKDHKERRGNDGMIDSGEEDLVDVLLRVQASDGLDFPLSANNIKAVMKDLFTAGTDTSATTIEWAMSELIRNPKVMEQAQAEVRKVLKGQNKVEEKDMDKLNYMKCVIKETFRLHPPTPLLVPRESREQCEINGYEIPIKTKVLINVWAIGRDPENWSNAESFEPERFEGSSIDFKGMDFKFIPFGAGRRICPGMSFGIADVELPLAQLLYHFDWKLANGIKPQEIDMSEAFGAAVRRKNDLYLIPTPYTS